MQKHGELSKIYDLVHGAGLDSLLRKHRPFTLFAPTSDAIKKLDDAQARYLRHEQGLDDLTITFNHHIHAGTLYKKDIHRGTSSVSTLEGQELLISLDDKLLVDNAEVERTDILASNGVIHTVSRPLLPNSLVWTAAKYLIGLNAVKFVNALREADLGHYIDSPEASFTIFAPQDDAFSPELLPGWLEAGDVLQYHIVRGKKLQANFEDGQLLETQLKTEQLNGRAQRSKINVKQDKKRTIVSINGIEINGEPGIDIVCSALSSAAPCTFHQIHLELTFCPVQLTSCSSSGQFGYLSDLPSFGAASSSGEEDEARRILVWIL